MTASNFGYRAFHGNVTYAGLAVLFYVLGEEGLTVLPDRSLYKM